MVNGAPGAFKESTQWSPKGDLQYSPKRIYEYLRDLQRNFIHHDTPNALLQIFTITYLLDQFGGLAVLHMRRIAKRAATACRPMVAPRLHRTKL